MIKKISENSLGEVVADNVEDLTVDYEEDGKLVSRQLDKEILTKGAWSTIIFRYQDWDRKKEEYGPDKYSIRRYQKRNGQYQQKSKHRNCWLPEHTKLPEYYG